MKTIVLEQLETRKVPSVDYYQSIPVDLDAKSVIQDGSSQAKPILSTNGAPESFTQPQNWHCV